MRDPSSLSNNGFVGQWVLKVPFCQPQQEGCSYYGLAEPELKRLLLFESREMIDLGNEGVYEGYRMNCFRFGGLLGVGIFCVSCSTVWTTAQKQASVPVAVLPATMRSGFYADPQKISLESSEATGWVSGLAGGLVGGALASVVVAGMQNDYEKDNEAQFDILEKHVMAVGMAEEMQSALTRELEKIPHFRGQIRGSAGTQFKTEMVGVTFGRLSSSSREHAWQCSAQFTCVSESGEVLFSEVISAKGHDLRPRPAQAPLESYVKNPELLKQHFGRVAERLCAQCAEAVRRKLGTK